MFVHHAFYHVLAVAVSTLSFCDAIETRSKVQSHHSDQRETTCCLTYSTRYPELYSAGSRGPSRAAEFTALTSA
ncbi:hypothetical protein EDD22DRAFT_875616 [Suillus occidentalis]|nr:hypothetical protein EDD22DRAFT_875616 [Suillus occidentalis]